MRWNRQFVAGAAAISLAAGGLLAPVGPLAAAEPDIISTDFEGQVTWQPDDAPEPEPLQPDCAEPPCEPVETVSGGIGGYVPVSPVRILQTRSGPGILGAVPADTRLDFDVAGFAGVPEDAGAVALNITAEQALRKSSLTVWPTPAQDPSPPPDITSLSTEPGRMRSAVVVSGIGADGQVSVYNLAGSVHLTIDIIGWFPSESDFTTVPPQRILSTLEGNNRAKGRIGQDPTDLQVTGVAEVPETGVAAVVLAVTSDWSTESSAVRMWPSDQFAPASRMLSTTPGHANTNLVIVEPGASGAVSVRVDAGETHLDVDIVGWLPQGSPFRLTSGVVLDTREDEPLAAGATVSVPVRGVGGVPQAGATGEEAHSVVLNLTSFDPVDKTTITVWSVDDADEPPDIVSLAADPLEDVDGTVANTSLAVVRLGPSGEISLHNADAAAHLLVDVVGWFANPTLATELAVPESTVVPEEDQVEAVVVEGDGTASVVLDGSAEPAEIGEHLVLGVTEGAPDGYLGMVTAVETNPDGEQELVLAQARLEEVFPEGDFSLDMSGEEFELAEPEVLAGDRASLAARAVSGSDTLFEIYWEWTGGQVGEDCDVTGILVSIGLGFDLKFAVKWRTFSKPVVTALVTLQPWALAQLDKLQIQCGVVIKDLESKTKVTMAGPVPVVYGYKLDLAADFYAGIEGLNLSAEAGATITVGVDRNKFLAVVKEPGFSYEPRNLGGLWENTRNLTAYAMADLWMRFYVHLYGVGPRIGVGPFVETFLTSDVNRPLWAVDVGYAGKVDLYIDLWFKDWSWTLFEGEIPVAALLKEAGAIPTCSVYGPGFAEGIKPCLTKAPQARPNGDTRFMADRIRLLSHGNSLFNMEPGLLKIVAPQTVPDATAGAEYTLELGKEGWFAGDATWHWDVAPDSVEGLAFSEQADKLLLTGTPAGKGIFQATVQLWYGPQPDDGYDDPDTCEPGVGRTTCDRWWGPTPPPEVEIVVKVPPPGGLKTIYVDDDAPGDPASPLGEKWKWAYPDVRQALDAAAADPDQAYEIRVAGGTYTPGSGRSDAFQMQPWTEIKGGYAGWDDLANPDHRDLDAHKTVLSGEIGDPTVTSDNSYHVFFHPIGTNLDGTAVLDGVTISGGNASVGDQHRQYGGGMYNQSSSPLLRNVRFEGNSAATRGGGMYNEESSPTLDGVTFLANTAAAGGGMANDSASPALTDVVFTSNHANPYDGGGMYNIASAPELTRVEFRSNVAARDGGGMHNNTSAPTLTGAVFIQNSAGRYGGGIDNYRSTGESPTLVNTRFEYNTANDAAAINSREQSITVRGGVFWKNTAWNSAGAVGLSKAATSSLANVTIVGNDAAATAAIRAYESKFVLVNAIVWGNTSDKDYTLYAYGPDPGKTGLEVRYSDVQDGVAIGEGNISADPMFVDGSEGDLRLRPGSPAIDAGTLAGSGWTPLDVDVAGDPRIDEHQRAIDMGAYETFNSAELFFVHDDATGANDGSSWADAYTELRDALARASVTDRIWVAAGTYTPGSERSDSFALKKGVEVYGGFAGDENPAFFDLEDRDFDVHRTVLSGDIGDAGNAYHVVFNAAGAGIDGTAVLDGVTISGGRADDSASSTHSKGGGMYNESASPTLRNIIFEGNTAVELGGGMRNYQSAPTLTNVVFDNNEVTAGGGGGMANAGVPATGPKAPVLRNVVFTNNRADNGAGGAIVVVDQDMTLRGGLLWNNSARTAGAVGVAFDRCCGQVSLTNTTIVENSATYQNPAIRNNDAAIQVHNSIVWMNALNGDTSPDPLHIHVGGSFDVQYSILQGRKVHPDVPGDLEPDSVFVDFTAGDLHLKSGSPAIDAGSDALTQDLATDIDGQARTILTVDMGADEFWPYPDAIEDEASTSMNLAVVVDVVANDTDPDGNLDPATVAVVESPTHGSPSVDAATGAVTYTPDADWHGIDSFVYRICDSDDLCDAATVTVTVTAVNRAPEAVDDDYVIGLDSELATAGDPEVWGSEGSGDGEFSLPQGVAVDAAGNIYVVDNGNHRVQKFDAAGDFLTTWGSEGSGDGQFNHPHGIAVDSDGFVYVSDTLNHRVQTFTADGEFVRAWGGAGCGDGQFTEPYGLAVDAAGEVYVTDYCNRVQVFDGDGTYLRGWGSAGAGDGELQLPEGVATDLSGHVYVADTGNHRVQQFTTAGDYVTAWGSMTPDPSEPEPGTFFYPVAVTVDAAGTVYVASDSRVQAFTDTGVFRYEVGRNPQFQLPRGLAIDADGRLLVTDAEANRVARFGGPSGVLANDVDADGDELTATLASDVAHGTLDLAADGSFSYVPDAGWSGTDSFTYVANDGAADSNEATATITVHQPGPVQAPPQAADDEAVTGMDRAVVVDVVANDTDPDGDLDPSTVTIATPPQHGSAAVEGAAGAISYTPESGWTGVDTFEYQVCDEAGLCDTAAVTVTVALGADLTVDSLADTLADDGACTLREAVLNANGNDQSGSTDCPTGIGADTITFAPGLTGTIVLTAGHLGELTDDLTIRGPGADLLTIDGNANPGQRVLSNKLAALEVSGMTLTNGLAINDSGGGLWNNGGAVTISDMVIAGNSAAYGGGIYNVGGGTMTITNSTISGNTATDHGGGIRNNGGTVTITNSTIAGNTADGFAGAIRNYNGGTVTVIDSTIAGNAAPTGGGIFNEATASVTRSIVASNTGGDCAGSLTDGGFNLASDDSCGFALVGDPLLGTLADNGGPTQTMLPTSVASPVIDAAGDACSATDQRGVTRPQGPACDIGAVEAVPVESSYEVVAQADGILWDDARAAAAAAARDGCTGHLATVTSQAESQRLIADFGSQLSFTWLGGYQDEPGDGSGDPAANWQWVTGEPWSFTYWQSGEPNDDGTGEDKLAVGGSTNPDEAYSWVDLASDRLFNGYVVEYDCPD